MSTLQSRASSLQGTTRGIPSILTHQLLAVGLCAAPGPEEPLRLSGRIFTGLNIEMKDQESLQTGVWLLSQC